MCTDDIIGYNTENVQFKERCRRNSIHFFYVFKIGSLQQFISEVRFFIPFSESFNVCRLVNFVSIDLILFSFESGAGALYFMSEKYLGKRKKEQEKMKMKKKPSRIEPL